MRQIYVDESIHVRGNFIVIAAVVTDYDVNPEIHSLLSEHGFRPKIDEFKSSMPMADNAPARLVRDEIKSIILAKCRAAFIVCSISERGSIMSLIARLVRQLRGREGVEPAIIYFDEGIAQQEIVLPYGLSSISRCNSKNVSGIQLADCAAHTISMLILAELGLVRKMVPSPDHYLDPEVELDWELWSEIRYSLSSGEPIGGYDLTGWCEPMMHPYGLLISENCTLEVSEAASRRLDGVWVGCIH